jgi:hypothetical protein
MFKVHSKVKFEDFLAFFYHIIGWKPEIRSRAAVFSFSTDISRDIVLLGIA